MNERSLRGVACALLALTLAGTAGAKDRPGKASPDAEKSSASKATGELVVAIRYLQAEGTSHAHLYLYREDGKFLRQLTREEKGQDRAPVYAPDGTTIVFTREVTTDAKEYWSVEPAGTGLQKLAAAPQWYAATGRSPFFTNLPPKDWPEDKQQPGTPTSKGEAPSPYKAPDGSVELLLGEVEGDDEDGPGHGAGYLLRNLKSGQETKLGNVPGFEGLWELLHGSIDPAQFFLLDGPLRVAFFGLHLNSMDGDTDYALDLQNPRLVRLSDNLATPFPLPGESAFLTLTYARYLPIPGSTKTANCSFVERWDASLKKISYVKPHAAPICYGASLYRPGKTPAVVSIADFD